jgi:PAS domain S-box-containing protein
MSEVGWITKWTKFAWQRAALFGVAFLVCAEIGNYLSPGNGMFLTLWLPAGLYLAALLRSEYRDWPWLALGAFCGNFAFDLLYGTRAEIICFFYAANTAQAMIGAWLIQRFITKKSTLATLKEFAGLVLFAGVIGAALGALIGVETLVHFGFSHSFGQSYKIWWGSNATAILMLAPFILAWAAKQQKPFFGSRRKILEGVFLFAGLNAGIWYLLVQDNGVMSPNKSVVIPFLLWAGLRFGVRGATITNLYLALVFSFLTAQFHFGLTTGQVSSGAYVFVMQTVLATGALISLIPAIVIGERDRSLADLRESEERFKNLSGAAFEGICISENGVVLDANNQFLAMFGFVKREDVIGKEIISLVAPEWRETVAEALRSGREEIYGHQLLRLDGSIFFAEARAKMIPMGGRLLRMTALRDVTERKRAEAELQASESRFRTLIEQAPLAVSISRGGTTMYVNQKFLELYGYRGIDELVGYPIYDHWPPEFRKMIEERVQKRQRGEEVPQEYEGVGLRKDGTRFPMYITVTGVQLPDGPAWLAFIADITERKRAEEALRESEEKFSKAFRSSPDGLAISELESGRLIEINDGYCHLYGYGREELIGPRAREVRIWEDPQDRADFIGKLKMDGFVRNLEARTRTCTGEMRVVLLSAEPIEVVGKACIVSVLHDITDRKRAELEKEAAIAREQEARLEYTLQLIASQEAERTRIAAELHDSLGQNLLLIKNHAQFAMMKGNIADDLVEQIEAISSLAVQSISEARGISHDLHPYQLDHLGLTRALKAMIEKAEESSGVAFKHKFDNVDDLFPKDAALNLYRVIQESLNNILKHSHASQARFTLERDVHEVQLTIVDDGRGFTPKKKNGSGMGLKNIAERSRILGGKLKVDSTPGQGARIEIVIPIRAEVE